MKQVIVDKRRQEIVTRGYSMGVAGQVEVDFFHRKNLRPSSSCSSSFDPKHWPQRRLPKRDGCAMTETGKAHSKPDGCCCLAFSKRGWIDGSYKYIPAEWCSM